MVPGLGLLRSLAFSLLLALPAPPVDILVPVQRYLISLRLGDTLEDVQAIYPPTRDWPTKREGESGIVRLQVEKSYAKAFPTHVSVIRLGLKGNRLVDIQLIYDASYTHRKPLSDLVRELEMVYGEPRRRGFRYWWKDSGAVILASNVEVPSPRGKGKELRTSIELMTLGAFHGLY